MSNPFPDLQTAIDTLQATEADENAAAQALMDAYGAVPARIQAAIDEALRRGATAAQLASLKVLNDQIASESQKLADALAAQP